MTKNLLVAVPLVAGAAVLSLTARSEESDRPPSKAPPVEVIGEPVDCVLTSRIRTTRVYDDYTIDFDLGGNDVYRNTLPNRCPQLGFEERFAYEASIGQLCAVDMIAVIQSGAGRGPRCGLGKFVPVRYVEAAGD